MAFDIRNRASELLSEGKEIQRIEGHTSAMGLFTVDGARTKKWLNDVNLLASRLPQNYPIRQEIETSYFHRKHPATFSNMISYLESVLSDKEFIGAQDLEQKNEEIGAEEEKEYDVFISHASKDKSIFVEELYKTISKLGVNIFYDKQEISWGDNWKKCIIDGTAKSEFAIIVISQNFFDREWTERELSEFLKQQNSAHQKKVLPLLFGISRQEMVSHYPDLEGIQYLSCDEYSVEEICILFGKELIKRLRKKKLLAINEGASFRQTKLHELLANWHKYDSPITGENPGEIAFGRLVNLFLDDSGRYEIAKPLLDEKYVTQLDAKRAECEQLLSEWVCADNADDAYVRKCSDSYFSAGKAFSDLLKTSINHQLNDLLGK